MVILMDGGGKFLAHIKSLPISDRIKLADAFVQQIQDKKVLLNKALQRANDNGMSIPSLNCGVLTMALLHDQLAALVWAANNECILDVVYRRFGLTPDFLFITANDLRQFLTISTALTDDILEQRAAVLNTLFQNIPENQRQAFLEKALMGDLGQAARALPDNDLKLAWFEDMLASYDPNLPDGQQLVDAFVGNRELVKAWEVARDFTDPTDVSLLTRLSNDLGDRPNLSSLIKTHVDPEGAFDTWNRVSKGESFVAETQFYDVMDELVPPAMDYNFVWIDPKTGEKFTWNAPTSGLKIYSNAPEGTFIIGGFGPDLKFILPQFPTATIGDPKDLKLPDHLNQLNDWISAGFPQPTGSQFNLLNVYDPLFFYVLDKPDKLVTFSTFTDRGGGVFFTYVNGPWMDAAVHQNKKILVASDVSNFVYDPIKGTLTGFGKEIHRLEWIHGYRFDPSMTSMVPPREGVGLPVLTKETDLDHGFN